MKQYNFKLIYQKYNKTANIIKTSVILFFLLVFISITILYCFGKFQIFHVLTNSSAPFHPAGSLAVDYKVDFNDLEVGDFITYSFNGGKSFVTHQIVRVDSENHKVLCSQQQFDDYGNVLPMEEWDENKFDGLGTPLYVTESQFYGKVVFSIPKLGLWLSSIKEMVITNNSLNILGLVSIVLAYLVYHFFGKLIYTPTYVLKEKRNWKSQKVT